MIMAFILRSATWVVFSNASRQIQCRALSLHSCYNVNYRLQCLPASCLYSSFNNPPNGRRNYNIHNNLLQAEDSSVTVALPLVIEQVNKDEHKKHPVHVPEKKQHRVFKTKTHFLNYFHRRLSNGKVIPVNHAFAFLKSCGQQMVHETNATRNELVTSVWGELKDNNSELENETGLWNALLSVYIENRYDFEPLDFLKDMWRKSNTAPDKSTFQRLIQAYAAKGDPVGAMKIVEFLIQNGGKMTEYIYGMIIEAYAKNGDMDGVNRMFISMKKINIKPKHFTYNRLINVHAEKGDIKAIDKTMEEMIEKNFYPTFVTFMNILENLSIGGHSTLLEKVWTKMEDNEYLMEDITPLIQRCVTRGDYESVFILLKKMNVMKSNDESRYYRFLENRLFRMLWSAKKDVNEYIAVTSMMEKYLNEHEFSRLRNIIEYLVHINEMDVAFKFLESLLSQKKTVTVEMFHPIIQGYAQKKCIDKIVKVYEFMVDKGISLDYNCIELARQSLSAEHHLYLEHVYLALRIKKLEQ